MEEGLFYLLQNKKKQEEVTSLILCNDKTQQYGLSLSEAEAGELVVCRNDSLKKYQRVEFGAGILDKLIYTFCDSQYINQDNYLDTLEQLQDIFYEFKNLSMDKLTDDELLDFMREQFEGVCFGDLEYLEDTCLDRFATAIRAGYTGYQQSGGSGKYSRLSEEQRWDKSVYMEVVKELFW